MDRDSQSDRLRRALVEQLKEGGNLTNPEVEAAFLAVPRHLFLPHIDDLEEIYSDEAIATKFEGESAISSSSQPAMMALMLEQLDLRPGHHVLEIGAGTGYNAALMAYLVGPGGQVTAVDLDEDIVEQAQDNLHRAGFDQVQVIQGDGGYGYLYAAPYDRIILTVGAWDILPAWVEQLAAAGRLVLPLSFNGPQKSVAFVRVDHHLESDSIYDCGFMRLRGAFAGPEQQLELAGGLYLDFEGKQQVEAAVVYEWLNGAAGRQATAVAVTLSEVWRGLHPWLALHEAQVCTLVATGEEVERGRVPCLFTLGSNWRTCFTPGLFGEEGLAVLDRPPHGEEFALDEEVEGMELWVRSYGPASDVAGQLVRQVQAWAAAGRPASAGLRLRAYPADYPYEAAAGEIVLPKRWTKLVVDWPVTIGD